MICKNCGQELPDGVGICMNCKTEVDNFSQVMEDNHELYGMSKCPKCGHIGVGVPGKIFKPKDIVIALVLSFLLFGIGIFYLLIVYGKRKNPENRDKVCPVCKTVLVPVDDKVKMSEIKGAVTAVATNEDIKHSAKKLRRNLKSMHNDMYLD